MMKTTELSTNRYEIIREIKKGRQGAIYFGHDAFYGKPVAIKVVGANESTGAPSELFPQSLAIAHVRHNNIVQFYDLQHDAGGGMNIIMEYIDGPALAPFLAMLKAKETPLPVSVAVHIIAEVCAALDYAHSLCDSNSHIPLKIVHQRLAPKKIMVNRDGEVKIIDFGMINMRRPFLPQNDEWLADGKICYLAPEQVNPLASIDGRTDIFSLGLILYELLTGQKLLPQENPQETIERLRTGSFNLSGSKAEAVPKPLLKTLKRAIACKPSQRYATANQMYVDLMSYLMESAPNVDLKGELASYVGKAFPQESWRAPQSPERSAIARQAAFEANDGNGFSPQDDRDNGNAMLTELETTTAKENKSMHLNDSHTDFSSSNKPYNSTPEQLAKENRQQSTAQNDALSSANRNNASHSVFRMSHSPSGASHRPPDFPHLPENGHEGAPDGSASAETNNPFFQESEKPAKSIGSDVWRSEEYEASSILLPENRKLANSQKEITKSSNNAMLPQGESDLLDTGTVRLSSNFYIHRDVDEKLRMQVQRTGSTTIIEGPRQMGKSSLLARAYAFAQKNKLKCCYIDFQFAGRTQMLSLETLYKNLTAKICRAFGIKQKVNELWDDFISAQDNFTYIMEEMILVDNTSPILILFDEVDAIFGLPFRDEFFSTIRGWHNLRAISEKWNLLNLIIAHSTEPYLWLEEFDESPFNVGQRLRLEGFTGDQIVALNYKHNCPLKSGAEIDELMRMVGGQPYLVRQALSSLVQHHWHLGKLWEVAADEEGPFGEHLHRIAVCLNENEKMKEAFCQVLRWNISPTESDFQRLKAAGLVKGKSHHATDASCELYNAYFRRVL